MLKLVVGNLVIWHIYKRYFDIGDTWAIFCHNTCENVSIYYMQNV